MHNYLFFTDLPSEDVDLVLNCESKYRMGLGMASWEYKE